MLKNTSASWGLAARLFHWVLGLAIIGMIAYGYWMNHWVTTRPERLFHRSIHADIGYAIMLFTALRLIWKAVNPAPALPAGTPLWEKAAAHISHFALYVLTFLVTGLGWAMAGAQNNYKTWFGLFDIPQFVSPDRQKGRDYEHWHIYMAYTLLALIVLHVLAALYHHFVKRDRVLTAMVSGTSH